MVKKIKDIACRNRKVLCVVGFVLLLLLGYILWKKAPGVPIPIWISIVSFFLAGLGILVTVHPPDKKQNALKWFYIISTSLLAGLVVALTWVQYYKDDAEKGRDRTEFATKLGGIQRGQDSLHKDFLKIAEQQAKAQFNPQLLAAVANAKEALARSDQEIGDLKSWVARKESMDAIDLLRNDQARIEAWTSRLPNQRATLNEMLPVWIEIVTRMGEILSKVGRDYYEGKISKTNDLLFANKVMAFFSINHPKDLVTNVVVAQMGLGTNSEWTSTCTIVAGNIMDDARPAEFNVQCKGKRDVLLQFVRRGKQVGVSLDVTGKRWNFPIDGYRTNVVDIVEYLFAVQADQFYSRTNSTKP